VDLGERYLADVGFGDGLFEPIALREGPVAQRGFRSRLERADAPFWRYCNHQFGGAPAFDFAEAPADEALLAARCHGLQTEAASPFTQNAVVQRHTRGGVEILRNCVRVSVRPDGATFRTLASGDAFLRELRDVFGLDLPEAARAWPIAQARGPDTIAALEEAGFARRK
jgi:N-hydroxyarylamine O-acetyltransferase